MLRLVGICGLLAGLVVMDNIERGIRWGAGVFGFLQAWKRNRQERRARKRAERTGQDVPAVEAEVSMLQGKLTYTGVAVLGLGWLLERFGVPVAAGELEGAVAAIVALVGAGTAIYGRWRATKAK